MRRLSEEFLAKYKDREPVWGPLGWVTYKRTYARLVEEEGRTEEWWETCRRVIEGNFNLIPDDPTFSQEEMERAYDLMFNLVWLPPGRGLWMSGTPRMARHGASQVNCWGIVVRPERYAPGEPKKVSYPFAFAMDQLMLGGGVGYNVQHKYVDQIPPVTTKVALKFACRVDHPDYAELRALPIELVAPEGDRIILEDSREGWVRGLREVIDAHFTGDGSCELVLDLSFIRQRGELIRGFGGVASGPAPLAEMLSHVNDKLNMRLGRKVRPIDAVDIMDLIGRCVIAGNVRRSALLAAGDPEPEFINLKNRKMYETMGGQRNEAGFFPFTRDQLLKLGYTEEQAQDIEYGLWALDNHRWASNNSVVVEDPDTFDWDSIVPSMVTNGEPGIINVDLARHYGRIADGRRENVDGEVVISNPCGEIMLADGEPCNLVEVFPLRAFQYGVPLGEVLRIAARYGYRVTFAEYHWPKSAEVIGRHRRIGVSLSGIQDWIAVCFGRAVEGWVTKNGERWPVYNDKLVHELDRMYLAVKLAVEDYARALGEQVPIKATTVKPSGTVSLLAGVSPGMHWHYFRQGIRRVRFADNDPLLDVLRQCGYRMESAIGAPHTTVVEFPVEAPSAHLPGFRSAGEVSLAEQMAVEALLQTYWSDNSVSVTLTFQPHEVKDIPRLLRQYRHILKSLTLLPYSGHGYAQAPYEPLDRNEYEERIRQVVASPETIYRKQKVQLGLTDTSVLDADCTGGACPIR